MIPVKKKIIILLLILMIGITILGITFFLFLNGQTIRNYLKPIIVKQLENNLGKNVIINEIQSISFNSLVFSNLIISDTTDTGNSIALLESESVKIYFDLAWAFSSFKNWELAITQLILQKAQLSLQRNTEGDFTFAKNLNLQTEALNSNVTFNRISFEESTLLFQDDSIQGSKKLIIEINDLNGSLDLAQLPKVEFEANGRMYKNDTSISLQGYLFIDKPHYSLDCQLDNVDMTEFQYYINDYEAFNLEKGLFDLNLVLNSDSTFEPAKISWQGEASLKGIDLKPDTLRDITLENITGLIQFEDLDIQINILQGFLQNQPFLLNGTLTFEEILNYNLDLKTDNLSLTTLKEEFKEYYPKTDLLANGDISLNMNIKGNLNDFQAKGTLSSSMLDIDGLQLEKPNLSFSFKEKMFRVESLKTQWEGAKIELEGTIDLKDAAPAYHFSALFNELDIENPDLGEIFNFEPYSGIVSGNIKIDGIFKDNSPIDLTGLFTAQKVTVLKNRLENPLTAQLKMKLMNPFSFELNQLTLSYLQNQLDISGKMKTGNQMDFQFKSNSILLEDFSFLENIENLSGIGSLNGMIQGTLSQPEIDSSLKLENVLWGNNSIDNFEGNLSYRFPFLQLKNVLMGNDDNHIQVDGQVDFQKDGKKAINLTLQITRLNMNYLVELLNFEEPISGWTSGIMDLQGNWPILLLDSQLNLNEIFIRDYYLGNGSIHFQLIPDNDPTENLIPLEQELLIEWLKNQYQLTLKELVFKQEDMDIIAQGKIDLKEDTPFLLDIDFKHNNLAEWINMADFGKLKIGSMFPAKIDGKIQITGDMFSQQILLNSQFSTPEEKTDLQHQLTVSLEKKGPVITLNELVLNQMSGNFLAKGILDTSRNLSDIEFQTKDFDLQSIAQLIEFKEELKGTLEITGTFKGPLNQPVISTSINIGEGYFREYEFQNLQSKIIWKENQLEIQELVISYQKNFKIMAQGQIPFPLATSGKTESQKQYFNQLPLNFKISLENTDLSFIQLFRVKDFKEVQGIVNLDLDLTGTVAQPIFNGNLTVNQGNMELTSSPIILSDIEAKINIVNNLVKIPKITLLINNILTNISGDFKLVNFKPEELHIKIWKEDGEIIYQDILTAQAKFLAEINGSIDSPDITGEFIFSKGTINGMPGFQLSSEKSNSFILSNANLDLSLEILDDFQFKAPNIDFKFNGGAKIKGKLSSPVFTGQLSVGKGYFLFLEQKFQFTEGKLLLNEFTGTDVLMDIKANAQVGQVTVFLNISGNLSSPQVSLSSKPVLSEPEILSLLTLNKNIINLSEGEIVDLFKEDIIELIFQGLGLKYLKKAESQIADYLRLDIFRIESIYNQDIEQTSLYDLNFKTTEIEFGKAINEDLFITYTTSLDAISSKSLGIDYNFQSDLSFNAEINTSELERSGTEIKFGFNFEF